jgi:AcrR family transcriptional regulator
VSLRSAAQAVGVSESAPYHHFAGKADLIGAAVAHAFDGLSDAIEAALSEVSVHDADPGLALAAAYVEYGLAHPGEYRLMFGEHVAALGLAGHARARAAGGRAALLSLEGIDRSRRRRGIEASLDDVFPPCWGMLHGLVTLVRDRELGEVTPDRGVALAVAGLDTLLRGWTVGSDAGGTSSSE